MFEGIYRAGAHLRDEALEAAVRASSIGARYLDGKATRRAVVVRKKDGTLLCNVVV